jgi:hypothetical protein
MGFNPKALEVQLGLNSCIRDVIDQEQSNFKFLNDN